MIRNMIERAYQLINEPIDPNQKCAVELVDIVNYKESEAGETVEYFSSPAQDRAQTVIESIDADGGLTYIKIPLKATTPVAFVGKQTKLETVLLDELMSSKDQTALGQKKYALGRALDNNEIRNVLNLCLGAGAGQEIHKTTGMDLLDVIIEMKQKISNYADSYVLLCASDVYDSIEKYDKENVATFNYKMGIKETIAGLNIVKIVKVLGDDNSTPCIALGKAILVGRNSKLAEEKPITFCRRKFSKEIAEYSGATEGAVRLISVVQAPVAVNLNGKNTLGFSVFGYESTIQVLLDSRMVSYSDEIIA